MIKCRGASRERRGDDTVIQVTACRGGRYWLSDRGDLKRVAPHVEIHFPKSSDSGKVPHNNLMGWHARMRTCRPQNWKPSSYIAGRTSSQSDLTQRPMRAIQEKRTDRAPTRYECESPCRETHGILMTHSTQVPHRNQPTQSKQVDRRGAIDTMTGNPTRQVFHRQPDRHRHPEYRKCMAVLQGSLCPKSTIPTMRFISALPRQIFL
jgi:hypothetical protein